MIEGKKVPLLVLLTPEQHRWLKKQSKIKGESMGAILRTMIRDAMRSR